MEDQSQAEELQRARQEGNLSQKQLDELERQTYADMGANSSDAARLAKGTSQEDITKTNKRKSEGGTIGGSIRGKNLRRKKHICTDEKAHHVVACDICKLIWQVHASLASNNNNNTMMVVNKPCHPDCEHGIGHKHSYVTRKPLATRPSRIAGIALVGTGRMLSEPTGEMDQDIVAELGHRATYGSELSVLEEGGNQEREEEGEDDGDDDM